jgi:hypothetical protein
MTATFDKLKAALEAKGTLTEEEIAQAVKDGGEMTAEENLWLSAEMHERQRTTQKKVTLEEFMEANKILDTADPSSEEYKNAEKIADAYLAGN